MSNLKTMLADHQKLARDLFSVLLGASTAKLFSFINMVIVARWLSQAEFGMFFLYYSILVLAWKTPRGIDLTYIRYAKHEDDINEKDRFLKLSIFYKALFSLFLIVVAVCAISFLDNTWLGDTNPWYIIFAGVISGISLAIYGTIEVIYQEKESFILFSILNGALSVLVALAFALYILTGTNLTLEIAIIIYSTSCIIIGICSLFFLAKRNGFSISNDKHLMQVFFSTGKWLIGTSLVFFITRRVEILMMPNYVSATDVGVYSAAAHIIMTVYLLIMTVTSVLMPKSIKAVKSIKLFKSYFKQALLSISVVILFILLLIALSQIAVELVYGVEYARSADIMIYLLIGLLFSVIYIPFSFFFYALDITWQRFGIDLITLVLIIVGVHLVAENGPEYVAIMKSVILSLSAMVSILILRFHLKRQFATMDSQAPVSQE